MKVFLGVMTLLATIAVPMSVHADEIVRYGVINGQLYAIPDSAQLGVDFKPDPERPWVIVIPKNSKIKLVGTEQKDTQKKNALETDEVLHVANVNVDTD